MIKLIIFDLDDTLISEEDYIRSGYRKVSEYMEAKYQLPQEEIYEEMINKYKKHEKNVFNKILDENDIKYTDNEIREIVSEYRNHIPQISFFNDVDETLRKLKEKNIKTAIISDGYIETQENKLRVLDAYEKFDYIILTDKLGKEYWKPNPRAFEIVKQKFGVKYEESLYIGDNPKKDFYIKKYYPIKTVRIIRKDSIYLNEDYLENIKEDIRIKKLNEIFQYMN